MPLNMVESTRTTNSSHSETESRKSYSRSVAQFRSSTLGLSASWLQRPTIWQQTDSRVCPVTSTTASKGGLRALRSVMGSTQPFKNRALVVNRGLLSGIRNRGILGGKRRAGSAPSSQVCSSLRTDGVQIDGMGTHLFRNGCSRWPEHITNNGSRKSHTNRPYSEGMSNDLVATSLEQYVGITSTLRPSRPFTALWFRGESRADRELVPGLLRSPYKEKIEKCEGTITTLFQEHAPAYCDDLPKDWVDRQVMMQHHGCPTRLLDWSESALVALYFAVKRLGKGRDNCDARIYVLDPYALSELNKSDDDRRNQLLQPGHILTSGYLRRFRINRLMQEGDFSYPIPLFPTHSTPRVVAQKSRLTLYPFKCVHLKPTVLREVKIPASAKEPLFWQLKLAGVTATTLFPDLEALAKELRCHVSRGDDSGW